MAKIAEYVQRGEAIDFKNATNAAIPAGAVVLLGKIAGVAGTEIAPGEVGLLHISGVFKIPKKTGVITAGQAVGYTDSAGIAAASASGGAIGVAVAAAEENDATALVLVTPLAYAPA